MVAWFTQDHAVEESAAGVCSQGMWLKTVPKITASHSISQDKVIM